MTMRLVPAPLRADDVLITVAAEAIDQARTDGGPITDRAILPIFLAICRRRLLEFDGLRAQYAIRAALATSREQAVARRLERFDFHKFETMLSAKYPTLAKHLAAAALARPAIVKGPGGDERPRAVRRTE